MQTTAMVEKTAEKIENAPSFEVIKEKGKEALKKFYQYCNYGEALTQEEYISALEIVIGVLYINTFGGRSLEWTSCTLEDVKDVLEGKTKYVVLQELQDCEDIWNEVYRLWWLDDSDVEDLCWKGRYL